MILSYSSIVHGGEGDKIHSKSEPRLGLIAVSPMGQVFLTDNEKNTSDGEATTFNSEAHINFFKAVFQFYGLDLDDVHNRGQQKHES